MNDLIRHLLGLRCRQYVTEHDFMPDAFRKSCAFEPEGGLYRAPCMLPERCHASRKLKAAPNRWN